MPTLLVVNSSAQLEERSLTRKLTALFSETFCERASDTRVIDRDLGRFPPDFVDHRFIEAAFTEPGQRDSRMTDALAQSDRLIDELECADIVVIGAPMYNYGMPAALKAWFDQVARIGRTFSFDLSRGDFPIEPLLSGKHLVVLSARGEFGFAPGGVREEQNALDPGIAACAHYLGASKASIDTIVVEYQEFKDDRHRASWEQASKATIELATRLASDFGSLQSGTTRSDVVEDRDGGRQDRKPVAGAAA
ncbi:FMN-dependent NADH-azoreductase [Qipengyuania sp.]